MSTEDVVAFVKDIVNSIRETEAVLYDKERMDLINAKINFVTEDSKQTEERLRKDGNVLSTAITEKKAEHQKQISNAKEHLSKAEPLSEEIAALQAQIQATEEYLKQNSVRLLHGLEKFEEKRDCLLAWKLLTGTELVEFSRSHFSGYHFNKYNNMYKTFELKNDSQVSEKLWALINENSGNDK